MSPTRTFVCLLTLLTLFLAPGVGGRSAAAQSSVAVEVGLVAQPCPEGDDAADAESNPTADVFAADDDERDCDAATPGEQPRRTGLDIGPVTVPTDLPFLRGDTADAAATPAAATEAAAGVAVSLNVSLCTPGDDAALRERLEEATNMGTVLQGEVITLDELNELCTAPDVPVTYHVRPARDAAQSGDILPQETAGDDVAAGSDDPSVIGWTGLEPGSVVTVAADLPEGYGEPIVVCTYQSIVDGFRTSFRTSVEAEGGVAELDLTNADAQTVECEWFNVDLGAE